MNAYELADELLRDNTQLTVKAAYMLRQQADQITMLEKETNALRKQLIAATSELMDIKR
jgi:capsule polysaccharide export protein KpsE/RkpR